MAGREGLRSMRYQSLLSEGWAQITCPQPVFLFILGRFPAHITLRPTVEAIPPQLNPFGNIPKAHQVILNPNQRVMNTAPSSLCVLYNRIITETAYQSRK